MYRNCQVIPDGPSIATQPQVNDALTGEPVKNVTFEFSINSNGAVASRNGNIVKKSAEKGGFVIKSMQDGMYKVKISKNGYANKESTVAVTNGEMARLTVKLAKTN